MDIFEYSQGSLGNGISVDASGRLIATTYNGQDLFAYAIGPNGFPIVVDASGRCVLSPLSSGLGGGGGSGESNTASNVGSSGVGLFKQKSGVDLQFKKIVAGSNITFVSSPDSVRITGSAGGEANTASNVGSSGVGVFKQKSSVDLELKKLVAGHELEILSTPDTLVFNNSKLVTLVSATGITVDLTTGNKFRLPLSHNTTFSFTGPRSASKYTFIIKQAVGSKTAAWPASVKWRGGSPPSLTAASGSRDIITMMYDNVEGVYLADYGLNFT